MKEVDYIVVGLGLAGMAFAEQLRLHNKSFVVFDKKIESASRVAAGLINPVILKRYTLPWLALEQYEVAVDYFNGLDNFLGINSFEEAPIRKILSSIEDQNNWFEATDKNGLDPFLSSHLSENNNKNIKAPYKLGVVTGSFKLVLPLLLDTYLDYLNGKEQLETSLFDYNKLIIEEKHVSYENYKARKIIFCEGFGLKFNPFFSKDSLVGNKGEYLIIKAPELKLTAVIKASIFIVPLGEDYYKVGATYHWTEKDWLPTTQAEEEITQKLQKIITCKFEVVNQVAGVRPTTLDRRPVLGTHPDHNKLAVFNGLGTRGTMMAPYWAKLLYQHLEVEIDLPPEVDINRIYKKKN